LASDSLFSAAAKVNLPLGRGHRVHPERDVLVDFRL
jgi:hypothetical protein